MELGVAPTAMARDAAADAECNLRIRNMATLAQSLNCPINYQVWKMPSSDEEHYDRYLIIVHVRGDWAFKKFLQHASACDLMLFRGLFLRMDVSRGEDRQLLQARVQQAFVPKFENDGADSQVAKDIVDNAHQRYMVVTIKHSGSLITLSSEVLGAKNSVNNTYTAGGQELIQAHFRRALGEELAEPHFTAFMEYLRTQRMAVGFEMVTTSHGHHGQVPAGEYLVALSASQVLRSGSVRFLEWEEFLQLCLEWHLPANDTWLFSGAAAAAARAVLDEAAGSGATTSEVLRRLDDVLQQPEAGGMRLPGTYPHEEWQGSRIEGFVVAQGQPVSPPQEARLHRLAERMTGRMIPLASVPSPLVKRFSRLEEQPPHRKRPRQEDSEALELSHGAAGEASGSAFTAMPSSARLQLLGSGAERSQLLQLLLGADAGESSSTEGGSGQLSIERLGRPSVVDGEALVYCRRTLAQASLPQLLAEIDRTIAAGRRGSDAEELKRVRNALLADVVGTEERARLVQLQLVRALAGAHELRQTLRYKKKMMMWSSSHMAYCMMTFLLRNGIHHLTDKRRPYPEQYLEYSRRLVARWKLAPEQRQRCQILAQAWARWLLKRGALPRLRSEDYLEHAEPFVADFLAGRCTEVERPPGAFQGVVVALNLPALLVDRLVAALHLQHRLAATDFAFSRELARGGCVVVWKPDEPLKLKKPDLEAAAPHLYVVKQPVQGGGSSNSSGRDKKANGMMGGMEKAARAALAAAGLADRQDQRIMTLTAQPMGSGVFSAGDDGAEGAGSAETAAGPAADGAGTQQGLRAEREASGTLGAGAFSRPMRAVLEGADEKQQGPGAEAMECDEDAGITHMLLQVTRFLGKGAPVPEMDAAAVLAFVSVPGIGKSTWANALREAGRTDAGTQRVWLSSDRQYRSKARRKHFWPECIREAATSRGDGRCTVVLADRNLVPNYVQDARATQLEVVALQIRSGGMAAVAVLPCVVDSGNPPCTTGAAAAGRDEAELCAAGREAYPFPPHLLLLCMLRVLSRTQHEGDLHGGSDAPLSVVASMAQQFRGMSAADLRQKAVANFQFVVEVPVIEAAAPGAIPAEVVQHLVEGLRTVDPRAKKQQLPRLWEDRMADLLRRADVAAALRQLEVPLARSLAVLEEQLQVIVGKLRPVGKPAAAAAAAAENTRASSESIRYIAVEGVPRLPLLAAVREQLGGEAERNVKPQLHITLWHPSKSGPDADPDRRKQLLADLDAGVTFQITHLDHSPQVTAARVELLQAPEAAFQTHYPHITLLVADGAKAADSVLLPTRIADPEDAATSIALPHPLLLEGVLAGRP